MAESEEFVAVPKRLMDRLEQELGSGSSSGRGRLRMDFSVSLGNLITLGVVLVVVILGADRLHTEMVAVSKSLAELKASSAVDSQKLTRLDTQFRGVRQDLRTFPLHKHIRDSRVEVYPSPNGGSGKESNED